MAKRKPQSKQRPPNATDRRLRAAYAKSKAKFGAADLQKFTETEEGVPIEQVLAELQAADRKLSRKKS